MSPHLWEKPTSREIVWDQNQMTTGFPEIDAQHKEWITRFNEFDKAITAHQGEAACADALLFFMRYTETHFRFEETLMKLNRCSAEAANKEEHIRFQARIQEITFKTWPMGATDEDVLSLRKELADWLVHHIGEIDVKLREVAKRS